MDASSSSPLRLAWLGAFVVATLAACGGGGDSPGTAAAGATTGGAAAAAPSTAGDAAAPSPDAGTTGDASAAGAATTAAEATPNAVAPDVAAPDGAADSAAQIDTSDAELNPQPDAELAAAFAATPSEQSTALAAPRLVTLQSGLAYPWGLAFLPDGNMLVTEKAGRLQWVKAGGGSQHAIAGLPRIQAGGQGGLLDVAVDPAFASNRRIYFTYVEGTSQSNGVAVGRAKLSADSRRLEQFTVIFRQLPKKAGNLHYGGRLAFSKIGTLFVTLGERHDYRSEVQRKGNHLGKVVHIHTDGTPYVANTAFSHDPSVARGVWSMGHRNPQGATVHPVTGKLWISEHGPQGGDEVNVITASRNYGWPKVSYGCEYGQPVGTSCAIGGGTHAPSFVEPVAKWTPLSTATGNLVFVTSNRFPEWRGSLMVAALKDKRVWRLTFDGTRLTSRQALFTDIGARVRDIRQGPDGWLYLLTDERNGRIVRIQR